MVSDVVKNIKNKFKNLNLKMSMIYINQYNYVNFSDELLNFDYHIRDFKRQNV